MSPQPLGQATSFPYSFPVISVLIPTWNEAAHLSAAVQALRRTAAEHEAIVIDARSSDATAQVAADLGLRLLICETRQRAAQLNLGAARARGEILLFLHADTLLPPQALEKITAALSAPGIGGGAFARQFDSPSRVLRLTCALAAFRNRAIGWHLGDQAMFVRKALFEKLHGFRLADRFEDLDFSRRLGRVSRLVTLRPPVLASARRFEKNGPARQTARDFLLTMRYLMGSSAALGRPPAV